MLDWLRRPPRDMPVVAVGDRELPLVVRRLERARRMTMRLSPDGSEVRVSLPRWGRTADALAFAESRRDWLARQLDTLPQNAAPAHGSTLPWRGEALRIEHDPRAPRLPRIDGEAIRLGGPAEGLDRRLRRWAEKQALALIAEDLTHYCALAGKPAPRLALSNARRRWGSCAGDGTIRINWRLILAPDMVRRSVVAHEVAHLVHFDHSPRFHALLGQLFEHDIAEANGWLREHGRGLYAWLG